MEIAISGVSMIRLHSYSRDFRLERKGLEVTGSYNNLAGALDTKATIDTKDDKRNYKIH